MSEEISDTSLMPFGKYKGQPMESVPTSYLNWLWNDGMKNQDTDVSRYISRSLDALKMEKPDLIWDSQETHS